MRLFDFKGKDPGSDRGSFIIVVRAENRVRAEMFVAEHLQVRGRPDLIGTARCVSTRPDYSEGVVHSDVECSSG